MSMQQINLYLPEFRPKQKILTANIVAICSLGLFAVLLVVAVLDNLQIKSMEQQIVEDESLKKIVKQRVDEMLTVPRPSDEQRLDRQIVQLREAIRSREQVGRIIEGQSFGNANGFSRAMKSLAKQSLSNIALERIKLSSGGEFVELKGLSTLPESIPQYIQKLQSESSLKNVHYGALSIAENSGPNTLHQFSLGFESVYASANGDVK